MTTTIVVPAVATLAMLVSSAEQAPGMLGLTTALWRFLTILPAFLPPSYMEEESSEAEQVILSSFSVAKPTDAQLLMPVSDWAAHVK
jgi:hypothetical protein